MLYEIFRNFLLLFRIMIESSLMGLLLVSLVPENPTLLQMEPKLRQKRCSKLPLGKCLLVRKVLLLKILLQII